MSASLLAGRYEVLEELARGGMGKVLRARDRLLDREVAVKQLLVRSGGGTLTARFIEESQVTGQLAHPNIVPVHDLGVDDGEPFLVMKLVRGRTLRDVVRALKAGERAALREFERPRLVRLFLKACEAVGYAHERGVIHRDLKPSNVMVSRGGEVLVMDWGLAKPFVGADTTPGTVRSQVRTVRMRALGSSGHPDTVREDGSSGAGSGGTSGELTNAGDIVGTPAYMPPEQVDDAARLDPRADVYSLGAVLYELLALRPPYDGNGVEIISSLVRAAPPRPRAAAPEQDIPPALEAIVLKAMSRRAAGRYDDAGALAADVARWLDGDAVLAYRETAREAVRRVVTRHKGVVVTLAASLLVVQAALLAGALAVRDEARNVRDRTAEAEAAAREAEQGRAAVEARTRGSELTERATALAGRAVVVASEVERRARTLLPLDAGDRAAGTGADLTLPDLRARARAELDGLRDELARAAAGPGATDVGSFLLEVEAAAQAVDAAYADALLARAPSRALAALEATGEARLSLEPGPRALALARAHHRLGRRREALAALEAAGDATGRAGAAFTAFLLDRDRLDSIEQRFTRAIEEQPDRAWLYLGRAQTRARRGDFGAATEDYGRAARLQPVDAWIYSSQVRFTFPLVSYHNEAKLLPATTALIKELAPENTEADECMPRGLLWSNGDWSGYVRWAEQLRATDPGRAARAGAEGALIVQRWVEAEAYAREALRHDAGDAAAVGCLAQARLEQGDAAQAEALARQGLERAADEHRCNGTLGRVLLGQGRVREALEHLRVGARGALSSDPWRHLAEACLASDDPATWEEGVVAARTGMSLDPYAVIYYHPGARPVAGDPRLHRVAGKLRLRQRRLGAAIAHFMRAFVLSRGRAQGALGLDLQDALLAGDVHEQLGLYNEALAVWGLVGDDPTFGPQAQERSRRLVERAGDGR